MRSLRRLLGVFRAAARQLGAAAVYSLLARSPRLARALAGPRLDGPQRLRRFFEDAGGAFLKLGQLLALQPDILPLRYCNELFDLLDRIDPSPYAEIETVFREEVGRTPDEAFDRFDHEPIATASIGQVHVAFRGGKKFAVKVRRIGADREFTEDIRMLHGLLQLVAFFRAEGFYWLRSPINEFIDWTSEELDYRQEARYMEEVRRNSRADPRSLIPQVDWGLTTRRTLVVEYCDGTTLLDLFRSLESGDEALLEKLRSEGYDPKTAAGNIIDIFLRDAFVFGIFHADLHPANLMILPGSVIGYVDFGITGSLSGTTRRRLAALTVAWSIGDLDEISELFFRLAGPSTEEERRAYRDGLEELAESWYGQGGGRAPAKRFTLVMLDMLALSHRTGIMPNRAVTRYLRSAIATDGLVKRFAPGLDVAAELEAGCRRYLLRLLAGDVFSPEGVASLAARLGELSPLPALSRLKAPGPARGSEAGAKKPARRALQLGILGFAFAALGFWTPAGPARGSGLLTAELGVSILSAFLVLLTLGRAKKTL